MVKVKSGMLDRVRSLGKEEMAGLTHGEVSLGSEDMAHRGSMEPTVGILLAPDDQHARCTASHASTVYGVHWWV